MIAKFLYSVNFKYSTLEIKIPALPVIDLPGSKTILIFDPFRALEIYDIKDSGFPGLSSL